MRTENDLRAAFGSLAGNAPDMAGVLAGTRAGVVRARRRRTVRWRAGGGLAVAAVTAAAAIVVAAGNAPAVAGHTALRAKLLAAIDSTADEILAEQFTEPPSVGGATVRSWYDPWGAQAGQQVRSRTFVLLRGKPWVDMGIHYAQPAPSTTTPMGEVNADEEITVDYGSRTWSDAKNGSTIGNVWNPAEIRAREAAEGWTVTGPVQFGGHQALELNGQNYHLWVDAQTYLPLRAETTYITGVTPGTVVTTFQLLPATEANLALVNPVIPPGFKQVTIRSSGPSSP